MDRDLRELVDAGLGAEVASQRIRERWLRRQAAEEATLAGLLTSLCAGGWSVTLLTSGGLTHQGSVAAVGRDYCTLVGARTQTHVAAAAIATVWPEPDAAGRAAPEPDPVVADRWLADVLGELADSRVRLSLGLLGRAERLSGTLTAVGADVLTLAPDGPAQPACYVPLSALADASLRGSG